MLNELLPIVTENGPAVIICAMFLYFLWMIGKQWRAAQTESNEGWRKTVSDMSDKTTLALKEQGDRMERISNKGHSAAHELAKEIAALRSDIKK